METSNEPDCDHDSTGHTTTALGDMRKCISGDARRQRRMSPDLHEVVRVVLKDDEVVLGSTCDGVQLLPALSGEGAPGRVTPRRNRVQHLQRQHRLEEVRPRMDNDTY